MTTQSAQVELIDEVKSLLKQYDSSERRIDDVSYRFSYRRANMLWLLGEGPIAMSLRKHILRKRLSSFWASHLNVSEERFVGWREINRGHIRSNEYYGEQPFCSAIISRGNRRCRLRAIRTIVDVPQQFFLGFSDRCSRHGRLMTQEEDIEYFMYQHNVDRTRAEEMFSMSPEDSGRIFAAAILGREKLPF